MKLTQTQLVVLREANKSRFSRCFTTVLTGSGSQGGRVSGGSRKENAARGLAAAGLMAMASQEESRNTKNGWSVHAHTTIWNITDAGRAALAAHEAANPPPVRSHL